MKLHSTFRVLVWKSPTAQYFPNGSFQQVSCNHVIEGYFGINMSGEIVPTIGATAVAGEGTTDFDQDSVGIAAGHVYPNVTQFIDSSFKSCVLIKDMDTQMSWYAETRSYNNSVESCNFCCTP